VTRPRLLDLFCCAGGASMGYHQAGFDVTGVDIVPRPRYPFEFVQADALTLDPVWVASFDAIAASPPCQFHTSMKTMHNAKEHLDLIEPTRALLVGSGVPWIMENVVGAPLKDPILLCGTMFGLGADGAEIQRHRLFETSFPILLHPECQHTAAPTIGIYGKGCRDSRRRYDKTIPEFTVVQGRAAMGCDWMTTAELSQAIPPAYTQFLGRHLMDHLQAQRAAA
jgi:DNA (cytosine-5)-methyltransferase 1